MPEFEHFAHFFAVMCHINIAALGLILFFYEDVHNKITGSVVTIKPQITIAKFDLDQKLRSELEEIMEGQRARVVWLSVKRLFYHIYLSLPLALVSLTERQVKKTNSQDDYVKKYLPFFLVVGVYCLIIVLLSAMITEYSHHQPTNVDHVHVYKVGIQWAWISTYTFALLSFSTNFFIPRKKNSIVRSILILIVAIVLPYVLFSFVDYSFFHSICTNYPGWFLFTAILITFLPILNIAYIYTVYKTSLVIGEYYSPVHKGWVDEMNGIGLKG